MMIYTAQRSWAIYGHVHSVVWPASDVFISPSPVGVRYISLSVYISFNPYALRFHG
jgi:hypothetical protein